MDDNRAKGTMSEKDISKEVPLEADNPFALRINLGEHVSDTEVQKALASGEIGFLHSFTTGSTVDGPGVRLVAWTSGCQFRCMYCHNPDTWKLKNGIPVTLSRATDELSKYRSGLKIMGGGFTLSGGEPLMQDRFAVRLFSAAKKMGIHTALDTNGSLGKRLSEEDLENIDLILMDVQLPIIDGVEAIRQIRSFKPHIPIIVQTANAFNDEWEKCFEAGCDEYINKPVNLPDLMLRIENLMCVPVVR